MNVLIIPTNRNAYPMPVMPLGACMVAEAAEPAGHAVRLLDLMFAADPVGEVNRLIRAHRPEVIGLSVRNIDNNDMRLPAFYIDELAPILKAIRRASPAPVVIGGAALTVMPEEIMRATTGRDPAGAGRLRQHVLAHGLVCLERTGNSRHCGE
ncbi:cobalamin-dependent protein [Desulfurivibrio sp. C05AmB]|uniref:cobalamin-dependent protein n=1 Tax=Desulfurivibrio sp. C05AmB TaxID=3374371 RepID=UPI00376F0E5F